MFVYQAVSLVSNLSNSSRKRGGLGKSVKRNLNIDGFNFTIAE